jgi:CheY-like chemotaxis protein
MARHLGGTIEVSSVLGEGSAFTLKLPGVLGASEVKNKVSYHSKEKKESSAKILVVEDDPANFTFLNAVLSKNGFKVYHSEDGLEAIKMATNGLGVDLVIMDLKLPQLDGIEATKAIKKERSDLPVIAYSAFVMNHEERQAKEAGCDMFLSKPARKHQILEAINKCLKQQK